MHAVTYGTWSPQGLVPEGEVVILSIRHMEVLNGLIAGKTNQDIARELGCSEQTLKNHVSAIMNYTNSDTRTEVVSKVLQGKIKLACSPFVRQRTENVKEAVTN